MAVIPHTPRFSRAAVRMALNPALVVLLLAAGSGESTPQDPISRSRPKIVHGGNQASPPFEYLDQGGTPRGFSIELIRALARVSGRDVEVRLGVWKDIVSEVATGEVDVVTLGYAEARRFWNGRRACARARNAACLPPRPRET